MIHPAINNNFLKWKARVIDPLQPLSEAFALLGHAVAFEWFDLETILAKAYVVRDLARTDTVSC